MKVFIENQEIESQIKQVLKLIKLRMNGETSGQMANMGIKYKLNFGVSSVHIKEIATTITPSLDLSERLWYRQSRECMLLALYTVPKDELTAEKCTEWMSLIDNIELIEQTARLVICHLPYASSFIQTLISEDKEELKALAYYSLGWMLQHQQTISKELNEKTINQLNKDNQSTSIPLHKAKTFFIRKYIKAFKETNQPIALYISELQNKNIPFLNKLAEDILMEIEFRVTNSI